MMSVIIMRMDFSIFHSENAKMTLTFPVQLELNKLRPVSKVESLTVFSCDVVSTSIIPSMKTTELAHAATKDIIIVPSIC